MKSTSYEFKFTSYEFKSMSYEFKSTSYEYKPTSCVFKSMSCQFKSTSSRIIKSMKIQVNTHDELDRVWTYLCGLSEQTSRVWAKAVSFILNEELFWNYQINPEKLHSMHPPHPPLSGTVL